MGAPRGAMSWLWMSKALDDQVVHSDGRGHLARVGDLVELVTQE